ncbi:hypothetical protein HPB51_005980 [Rhipicephalus microplus]|uniref:Uncharacterized protein n=1 Tax=Rhipicephalus microplus TaxID=6941 RepID=A0A9J6DL18_RHIMP|nr:hypothetical protein HPB51_005980 [Rhipicephalus microplus]
MASGNSSRSTTRDDTSDDSAATSHNESSHKENSSADDKQVEAPISVDVENVAPLSEGVARSLEAGITAASSDSPPKPAKMEANDARMLSTDVMERVSEQALPSSSKGPIFLHRNSAETCRGEALVSALSGAPIQRKPFVRVMIDARLPLALRRRTDHEWQIQRRPPEKGWVESGELDLLAASCE